MVEWEITAQDVNTQGIEFHRGTGLIIEEADETRALDLARRVLPGLTPRMVGVKTPGPEKEPGKPRRWSEGMVRNLLVDYGGGTAYVDGTGADRYVLIHYNTELANTLMRVARLRQDLELDLPRPPSVDTSTAASDTDRPPPSRADKARALMRDTTPSVGAPIPKRRVAMRTMWPPKATIGREPVEMELDLAPDEYVAGVVWGQEASPGFIVVRDRHLTAKERRVVVRLDEDEEVTILDGTVRVPVEFDADQYGWLTALAEDLRSGSLSEAVQVCVADHLEADRNGGGNPSAYTAVKSFEDALKRSDWRDMAVVLERLRLMYERRELDVRLRDQGQESSSSQDTSRRSDP